MSTTQSPRPQAPNSDRRRLKHFFVKPKYQMKYSNWYIRGAFITLVATTLLVHHILSDITPLLSLDSRELAAQDGALVEIYAAFTNVIMIALAGFVIFTLYACGLAILLNHRVSGPVLALVDRIEQIQAGRYTNPRDLREHDELKPISDALDDLEQSLQSSQSRSKPEGS